MPECSWVGYFRNGWEWVSHTFFYGRASAKVCVATGEKICQEVELAIGGKGSTHGGFSYDCEKGLEGTGFCFDGIVLTAEGAVQFSIDNEYKTVSLSLNTDALLKGCE